MVSKAPQNNKIFVQTQQKSSLKIRLSICVRNVAPLKEPQKYFLTLFLYCIPKVAPPPAYMG